MDNKTTSDRQETIFNQPVFFKLNFQASKQLFQKIKGYDSRKRINDNKGYFELETVYWITILVSFTLLTYQLHQHIKKERTTQIRKFKNEWERI